MVEYFWKWSVDWRLVAYVGTGEADHEVVLLLVSLLAADLIIVLYRGDRVSMK